MPTTEKEQYIKHNFEIPKQHTELNTASCIIEKLSVQVNIAINDNLIDDTLHNDYFEEIVKMLDYLGRISSFIFPIEDALYESYKMKYLHAPKLGIKLWTDYCESLHKPYSKLKNKCYKILDDLDNAYIKKFNQNPPNWNV